MKRVKKQATCLLLFFLLTGLTTLNAQVVAIKDLSHKRQYYYDSLKKMNYDRIFPIYGDKVYKKGFDIPFPFGIMINNFVGRQDVLISNLQVSVRDGDTILGPADLSDVIEFSKVEAKVYNLNLRADMYIFPFLNVYGLLSYLPHASTEVAVSKPVEFSTKAEQHGWAYGFGIMGAGGVGPAWLQADYSINWADMQLLDNKVVTQIMGIRLGHVFPSKLDPQKNISVWIGAMGIFINNDTKGEVALDEIFSGISQEKIDEIKQSYNSWYDKLDPAEKKVIDKIVQKLQDKVDNRPTRDVHIIYEMDKDLKSNWAGLMGVQFQFNKRWQLRSESNFIGGNRFSVLLSLNYRFLGFKKK
ncbi:hypothetical protein OCK74_24490 [Chitinophagaceae bacterium LB-8]|uniref:Outer membrane protein beta-barrel domain-containing protein n=1 Tax=Paraflavisolibacter caeni TaxID=2982496 RepID=A0A9X2Y0G9_9BACT|nr:hypothetical protein [Paraflavisolibacter caeni]MCU7552301.1 hypothetical protein [Paraflavisolibacter caeni]